MGQGKFSVDQIFWVKDALVVSAAWAGLFEAIGVAVNVNVQAKGRVVYDMFVGGELVVTRAIVPGEVGAEVQVQL